MNELPPPAPKGKSYYSFQLDSILLARRTPRLLIADDMGTGKTIQAIGILNDQPSIKKVLIICPAILRQNWVREIQTWYVAKRITVGVATTKHWSYADIVITNYEALKPLHRNIHETKWDMIIVDECHRLKNHLSRRAIEVFGSRHKDPLKRRPRLETPRAVFLTGTPIVNRPAEIWPIINYLAPEKFPSRKAFINEFCGGKAKNQNIKDIGRDTLEKLYKKLSSTIMIRRRKSEVLPQLPPKIRQVIVLPDDQLRGALNQEQQQFQDVQRKLARARIYAELAKTEPDGRKYLEAVKALREVELYSINQITAIRFQTALAKVPLVVKHVQNVLEHVDKVVLFAHHKAVIENLAVEFGEAVVKVNSDTPHKVRTEYVDKFQSDPQCRLFLGSLRAAGEGLTLTASQVIVFAEQDWTPAVMHQAEDRLHRIGAKGSVLAQYLVLDRSIDANLAHRIVEKQETISAAMDPGQAQVESLYALSKATPFVAETRDEILEMGRSLSRADIEKIHTALDQMYRAGLMPGMSQLDLTLIQILAEADYLSGNEAALGYSLIRKHAK